MMINAANVAAVRAAISSGQATGNFLPTVYVIDPRSKCNIDCVTCPNRKIAPNNLGEISEANFTDILEKIAPYCEFLMLYWMGEPLLHPKIHDLLSIARKKIFGKIVVSTNMTHLPPEVAEALVQSCDVVLCCIDRWDKSAFERIRRGANFDDVVANTERLTSIAKRHPTCDVVVKALDFNMPQSEAEEFQRHWISKGATPLVAWLNDWAGTFPQLRKVASMPIPRTSSLRTSCADLWFKCVINWRGEVQMCCFDWEYKFRVGNLVGDTLQSLWHSPSLEKLRTDHAMRMWGKNSLCAQCSSWGEPVEHDAYVSFSRDSYYTVF